MEILRFAQNDCFLRLCNFPAFSRGALDTLLEPGYFKIAMPTILRTGPYRFFFYAGDSTEPAHVHVERDENMAKFWLDPVRLNTTGGFRRVEINKILKLINEHHQELLEAWHEYFGN